MNKISQGHVPRIDPQVILPSFSPVNFLEIPSSQPLHKSVPVKSPSDTVTPCQDVRQVLQACQQLSEAIHTQLGIHQEIRHALLPASVRPGETDGEWDHGHQWKKVRWSRFEICLAYGSYIETH